jgi:hypothetical protein
VEGCSARQRARQRLAANEAMGAGSAAHTGSAPNLLAAGASVPRYVLGQCCVLLRSLCNTREAMQGGVCVDTITSCETQLMKPGVTRTHVETTGQTGQTRL